MVLSHGHFHRRKAETQREMQERSLESAEEAESAEGHLV
jgi:hypothetical protein